MNTGREDCLPYRELARQGSRISRSFDTKKLRRICALLDPDPLAATALGREIAGPEAVALDLRFRLDQEGYAWVEGFAEVTLSLLCHRCAQRLDYPLRAEFDLCIVVEGPAAEQLAQNRDLLVVEGSTVSLVEIVEDELLLALPDWLCSAEPCERMPSLAYPAVEGLAAQSVAADVEPPQEDNPFAVLQALKAPQQKENKDS
jgi:uncharacterized protein